MSKDNGKNQESNAKKAIRIANMQADFVGQGFEKLDDNLISTHAPKIKWGLKYQGFTDKEKIKYLEKLASTMNHAAHLIQEERNELLILNAKQEQMLIAIGEAMEANNDMLHSEIIKVNDERKEMNEQGQKLKGDDIRKYLANVEKMKDGDNSGSDS